MRTNQLRFNPDKVNAVLRDFFPSCSQIQVCPILECQMTLTAFLHGHLQLFLSRIWIFSLCYVCVICTGLLPHVPHRVLLEEDFENIAGQKTRPPKYFTMLNSQRTLYLLTGRLTYVYAAIHQDVSTNSQKPQHVVLLSEALHVLVMLSPQLRHTGVESPN